MVTVLWRIAIVVPVVAANPTHVELLVNQGIPRSISSGETTRANTRECGWLSFIGWSLIVGGVVLSRIGVACEGEVTDGAIPKRGIRDDGVLSDSECATVEVYSPFAVVCYTCVRRSSTEPEPTRDSVLVIG